MATLELRHLSKTYPNGDPAVRDLDLTIRDGELFVLVGPSGCGKTTVLRLVAGLEEPTVGDVVIDGVRVNDVTTRERDIAMAFQHGALYPHMTVAENIGFALKMARVRKAEQARRVHAVAQLLDLDDVLDRRPAKISGGQQQRVAMGRALIRNPRLFLMDEPMSNLDAKLRTEARAEILKIQRRLGVTTMYVTHDQVEAMALGDRVGVMNAGRLVQCGPPTEVYHAPADLFVAQFMGSPPMNVVLASIVAARDGLTLCIGSHVVPLDQGTVAERLRGLAGRDVAVGIRPEAFRHDDRGGSMTLSLDFTELLGSEQLAHATVDAPAVSLTDGVVHIAPEPSTTIAATVDPHDDLDRWKPFRLSVDTSRLHFFDLTSGAPILRVIDPGRPPLRG
jgi:multiple sugar transport system ATP-binding protein